MSFPNRFLLAILLSLFLAACATKAPVQPGPRGTLRLHGHPADAHVEIDEVTLVPIHMFKEKGLLLRPGTHRLVVRAEDYFPEYRLVEIADGQLLVLEIALRPMPD